MDPTGCRYPERDAIATVVTGVSASVELFERAAEHDADLVLVHHGLFWGATGPHRRASSSAAWSCCSTHDMALAAYHLPLDAHLEVGNNALLAEAIGATDHEPFAGIGVRARLPEHLARRATRARA